MKILSAPTAAAAAAMPAGARRAGAISARKWNDTDGEMTQWRDNPTVAPMALKKIKKQFGQICPKANISFEGVLGA